MKALVPARAMPLPPPAERMYAARPALIPATPQNIACVSGAYRDLKFAAGPYRGFTLTPLGDPVWDDAERVELSGGRWYYKGNCNAFAPELQRRIIAALILAGVPAEVAVACVTLVVCQIEDLDARTGRVLRSENHMVVRVACADQSTGDPIDWICCSKQGCYRLDSGRWGNAWVRYAWDRGETAESGCPGRGWVSYRRATLADLAG